MDKNDIWANVDAKIETHEQRKKKAALELEKKTNEVMHTFEIFKAAIVDYIPIAKQYGIKSTDANFSKVVKEKTFFRRERKLKRVCMPAYSLALSYYSSDAFYATHYAMYLSEDGRILLCCDYDGYSGWNDFSLFNISEFKKRISETLNSCSMPFPKGRNYIYGSVLESLIRLTYHFTSIDTAPMYSRTRSFQCAFQWDKLRSEEEIKALIQEFFASRILEQRTTS